MAQVDREQQRHTLSSHASPTRDLDLPLVVDDNQIGNEMGDDEDFNDDFVRYRVQAARTLYHQPRSESDTLNSTQSLYDTDIEYVTFEERQYCENYTFPSDNKEQGRLQMLHDVYLRILDGNLTMAPVQDPRKILDIGTGTGEWAMAMAEIHPKADVIGTDIAKIQPTSVTSNMDFQIDDAEYEGGWTWQPDSFDLVHFRNMIGAFEDWDHIYREAFKAIKPGGYVEAMDLNISDFPNYFTDDPVVVTWFETFLEATKTAKRPMTLDHLETKTLERAGFTVIENITKTIPCGIWPRDSEEQKTGMHFLSVVYDGIEAASMRLFVEQLGRDPDDVKRMCKDVVKSIKLMAHDAQRSKGWCMDVRVIVGRKPGGNELEVPDDKSTTGDSMRTITNADSGR